MPGIEHRVTLTTPQVLVLIFNQIPDSCYTVTQNSKQSEKHGMTLIFLCLWKWWIYFETFYWQFNACIQCTTSLSIVCFAFPHTLPIQSLSFPHLCPFFFLNKQNQNNYIKITHLIWISAGIYYLMVVAWSWQVTIAVVSSWVWVPCDVQKIAFPNTAPQPVALTFFPLRLLWCPWTLGCLYFYDFSFKFSWNKHTLWMTEMSVSKGKARENLLN